MTEMKERLPSINQAIEKAIHERYWDVQNTKVLQNKEYNEDNEKAKELENKIHSLLSGELEDLFNNYVSASNLAESTAARICYRQGLRDGMALPKAWGVLLMVNNQNGLFHIGTSIVNEYFPNSHKWPELYTSQLNA